MKGMILAAGFGERILPLTHILPKPLIPVANIPSIEYSINLLKNNGITEIIVNTHYKTRDLINYFQNRVKIGMDIQFSHEEILLGTAGGIKRAEKFLKGDTFIVINSDIVIDIDLNEVVEFHKEKGALVTMVLREDKDAERYGIIGIDSENRVKRFLNEGVSVFKSLKNMMFTGIQIFEQEIFGELPPVRPCSISEEMYPVLISKGCPVFGYLTKKYWMDIGTHRRYLEVNHDILQNKYSSFKGMAEARGVSLNLDNKFKNKDINIIPPVIIDESSIIKKGCNIGPYVVLGKNSILGQGVAIRESVVWRDVRISDHAEISNSIIGLDLKVDKGAKIKEKVVIKKDDKTRLYPINE